jgi:hypothetical protein
MNNGEVVYLPRLALLDVIMERQFHAGKVLTGSRAATKEEFFGFRSLDIVTLHRRKYDLPDVGLFFRLRDGRVIDAFGRSQEPDPRLYDHVMLESSARY